MSDNMRPTNLTPHLKHWATTFMLILLLPYALDLGRVILEKQASNLPLLCGWWLYFNFQY